MSLAIPATRSTDTHGLLPRLGYFVLGSLLLHALVVALWRGEPDAGPVGQGTFQITVLARHGGTPGEAGAEAGQQENNDDTQQSIKSSESSSEHTALDVAEGGKPLPITTLAASLPQPRTGSHAGLEKPHNKAPEKAKSQLTKRHAAPARGDISATPGSDGHGQQKLSSAAKYRRVRAALHEALLPRFDYPSLARRRGWQGRVRIGLHVEADGDLIRIHLLESSGHALLDKAAVKNVTELRNVPGAIQWLDGLDMDVILPVSYRLHDH
ncbi:MAG: energy transducer TonB [Pseudomonadota bacterium]|nr:energy transducer TonB [Pseudomonadota bacterium]